MREQDGSKRIIRLFGSFEATVGSAPLPELRSQKGKWLLALLALRQGQETSRVWLASTLWPDSLQSEALTSLRQSLSDLRRALGDPAEGLLIVTTNTLCLSVERADVDVRTFDRLITKDDPDALQRAVALYRGPLLEECAEPWALLERETRQQQFVKALEKLAAYATAAGGDDQALDYLRRGVATEPTNEPLHIALLHSLTRLGDYGGAVLAYQALRRRLQEEFLAQPSPELQSLYLKIRAEADRRARPSRPVAPSVVSLPIVRVPHPLTPLIGREAQTQQILAQLALARLVTLVGTGGAGKTRLALHIALLLAEEYADGVWFVDLSTLHASDLLPQQVALALGVPEERGRTRLETLIDFLRSKQLLLILDNCEPVVAACAELAASLLSSCPKLRILATSRWKLNLMGENVCQVSGLALPEAAPSLDAPTLLQSEAARLFVERARAIRVDLPLTSRDVLAIARLCALLDGLPLALELAAALVETLTPDEIVARLEVGLDFPFSDDPVRPRRHRSLEALLESSITLLTPPEQTLLQRCAVFSGVWTREEADALCADAPPDRPDLLPLLSRLVAKSLVIAEPRDGKTRYRMLDVIRRYAEKKIEQSGEADALRRRHLALSLQLAEEAERRLTGPEQAHWLTHMDDAYDNLRAALRFAEMTDATAMLRLVNALGRFQQIRGYWSEGKRWIERALAKPGNENEQALRASALNWASILATYQGEMNEGQAFAEQGLSIWETLADMRGIASSLGCLGIVAANRGDYIAARTYHEKSLELARFEQDESGMAASLGYLGNIATATGDFEGAKTYFTASLELRRALNDAWGVAASLNNLGLLARNRRDWTEARRRLAASLEMRRALGDRRCLAISLNLLGQCDCEEGDLSSAREHLEESLNLSLEVGDKRSIAYAVEAFAALAMYEERPEHATLLFGFAAALRETIGSPLPPSEQPAYSAKQRNLQMTLGEAAYQHQRLTGKALSLEQAVNYALHTQGSP